MSGSPNDHPASLELQELRALRGDVATLTASVREVIKLVELLRSATLGLRDRVAELEDDRDQALEAALSAPLTPPPLRAGVRGSVPPDHEDRGR